MKIHTNLATVCKPLALGFLCRFRLQTFVRIVTIRSRFVKSARSRQRCFGYAWGRALDTSAGQLSADDLNAKIITPYCTLN